MKRRVKVEEWKCPALGWFIPGFDAIAISTLLAVSSMLFDSALPVTKLPDIPAEHHLGGWGFAYAELDAAGRVYHRGWPIAPERYRELFTEFVRGNHLRATRLGFSGWENETLGWVSTLRLELRIDREAPVQRLKAVLLAAADAGIHRIAFPTHSGGTVMFRVPVASWSWEGPMDHEGALEVTGHSESAFRFPVGPGFTAETLRQRLGSATAQLDKHSRVRLYIANDARIADALRALKILREFQLHIVIMLDECDELVVHGRQENPVLKSRR